jgi:hypothetical protein
MLSQLIGTGGAVEPESQFVFIVYERDTGAVRHVHQVVNLPGAEARDREQMEQTALSYVSPQERDRESTGLTVLTVSPQELERGKVYRVDHERQVLMPAERER